MTITFNSTDKILITGTGGMVGAALKRQIASESTVTLLTPTRAELDLTDYNSVYSFFMKHEPTHVFHAAAKVFGLGGNMKFPGDMFYINSTINSNVIQCARLVSVKKITAVGTGCVYPEAYNGVYLKEDQVWEGPPHGSEWAYAQAKRGMLAHLVTYNQQYGIDYTYAICGNLYGPHDLFNVQYGHVVPSLIAKFHDAYRNDGEVSVWGTGVATRDFSYVEDAANAIILAHQRLSGAVNIATGNVCTIRDVVETLDQLTGKRLAITWDQTKPDGQSKRFYDLSRLESIGFKPRYDLKAGLSETWAWYNEHYPNLRQ